MKTANLHGKIKKRLRRPYPLPQLRPALFRFLIGVMDPWATLNGVFTVPLKFMSGWEWENAWLVYTLMGTIVLPWILVGASIPNVVEVYSGAPLSEVAMAAGASALQLIRVDAL